MVNEPFEIWEHRIDELLDKKLKPIKRNLRLQASVLKRLQQFVASNEIFSEANACRSKVLSTDLEDITFLEQLTAKLSLAYKEARTSPDPLSVTASFTKWCTEEQKKLGIEFIDVPH